MSHLCSSTSFLFKGIGGFKKFVNTIDNANLVKTHPEIERKLKCINFFDKYGMPATIDAFNVSRASIYLWKKKFKTSNCKLFSLINRSTKPHNTRRMFVESKVLDFIQAIRKQYPMISKDKIKPLLDEFCHKNNLDSISVSKIGKIIKRNNWFFYLHDRSKPSSTKKKKLRVFGYPVDKVGDLMQVDTIVKFHNGIKRYIFTAIEVKSKFAFSYAYPTHSSNNAADFIEKLIQISPFSIKAIQTDNGSEFLKKADKSMLDNGIVHFFSYPNSPKQNAFVERFNRTIQEEFINYHEQTLAYERNDFNNELIDYLLFYNTKRIHQSIGNIVPMDYIIANTNINKSNMYGTGTLS